MANDITVLQAFVLYLVSDWSILEEPYLPATNPHAVANLGLPHKDGYSLVGPELCRLDIGFRCREDCTSAFPARG